LIFYGNVTKVVKLMIFDNFSDLVN